MGAPRGAAYPFPPYLAQFGPERPPFREGPPALSPVSKGSCKLPHELSEGRQPGLVPGSSGPSLPG